MSFQLTLELVKSNSGLHVFIDPELSHRFIEIEALIQRILGVSAPTKKSMANSFADTPFVDAITLV